MATKVDNLELIKGFLADAVEVIGWEQAERARGLGLLPVGKRITPRQGRMARAALKRTCQDIGLLAGLAGPSISRFESDYPCTDGTVLQIRTAYEREGVLFYDSNDRVGMKK